MGETKTIEFEGQNLIQWIFDMMKDDNRPLKMIRKIFNSKIMVITSDYDDGSGETAFFIMPNCNCKRCNDMKQLVLQGIEDNKPINELNKDLELFRRDCGAAQ